MLTLLVKSLIIGLAIAAPVGPIGVLCIQRALENGFKIGLMTGLGAAIADGTYGLVAAFGLTTLSSLLIAYQFWVRVVGGLFLIYLGIKLFFSSFKGKLKSSPDRSLWHVLSTSYLLTLTNPVTILSFIGIFAGLGLGTAHSSYTDAVVLVLGITMGSVVWWIVLNGGVAFIWHRRLSFTVMRGVNRFSGVVIFIFGLLALFVR